MNSCRAATRCLITPHSTNNSLGKIIKMNVETKQVTVEAKQIKINKIEVKIGNIYWRVQKLLLSYEEVNQNRAQNKRKKHTKKTFIYMLKIIYKSKKEMGGEKSIVHESKKKVTINN